MLPEQFIQEFTKVFTNIPFNRTLGLELCAIESEKITLSLKQKPELIGNFFQGILHGGVISSVLDMAGGVAAMLDVVKKLQKLTLEEITQQLNKASTVNLHVDYLRPGKGNSFIAKANVIHSGNKLTVTRMDFFNDSEHLIATSTGTYLVGS